MELDLNFNIEDIELDIDFNIDNGLNTRYTKPIIDPEIKEEYLSYKKAVELAKNIELLKSSRQFVFLDGSFYFGDFIEALIVEKNYFVEELTVSTLSMNQNNIDSLANLLKGGYVGKLNLIISHYFYSHERHDLIPYIYETLDINNQFQLVVVRSHCKICLIKTDNNDKIVIHGSANLRSSGNFEQMMIENNENLYDFNYEYQKTMMKRYSTIKKEQ